MPYSKTTNHFKIPYMGAGDYMSESENSRQMNMVDGLLYSAVGGMVNCFFVVGEMAISDVVAEDQEESEEISQGEKTYKLVVLAEQESGFSISGVINNRPFYSRSTIECGDLEIGSSISDPNTGEEIGGKTYWVYVEAKSGMDLDALFENPENFEIGAYDEEQDEDGEKMLLCKIVGKPKTNLDGSLDADWSFDNSVERRYGTTILSHISDSYNPHGNILRQSRIEIEDSLSIDESAVYGVEVGYFMSSGPNQDEEVDFPEGKDVVFVCAFAEDLDAGNIAWTIDSENRKVRFRNSGDSGKKINYRFDVAKSSD